jgi:hypothetical protein
MKVIYSIAILVLLASCSPSSDGNSVTNNSMPKLITETDGWHIVRKDSANNPFSIDAIPGKIFFANNKIYYSVQELPSNLNPPEFVGYFKKCNLDGSGRKTSDFLTSHYNKNELEFVCEGSPTEYSYFKGGSLKQQNFNADGTLNGTPIESMGFSYFAGKFSNPLSFSSNAKCFVGNGFGYPYIVDVQNHTLKPFNWTSAPPNDGTPFNPIPVFDEDYCKANPNHYRLFGASVGRIKEKYYIPPYNPCDIAVHYMLDTAPATNGYGNPYYANAVLMDTIHYKHQNQNRFAATLECATDNQNLYVFVINQNLSGIASTADLIIYDKNTNVRKKYFQNITMPSANYLASYCQIVAVPSKNYLAVLMGGKKLMKLDITTATATDITPTVGIGITFGNGIFENNGRVYTQVAGKPSGSPLTWSNLIYYE